MNNLKDTYICTFGTVSRNLYFVMLYAATITDQIKPRKYTVGMKVVPTGKKYHFSSARICLLTD